jgi:transcriptional regulator with XRE-family HTH domain
VDDLAIGRLFRELRIRLGWRQQDLSARIGISDSLYSQIERGQFDRIKLETIRSAARVLEVRLPFAPRWRGAEIDRIISSRHASMTEVITRFLQAAGWEVRVEVSFSHFGERGVVDVVAWHASARALLLIEIKTELADVHDLLAVADRRRRLALVIAAPFGWAPMLVGEWVVLAPSRTNERRLHDSRALLRADLPDDGRAINGWLAKPTRPIAALSFLPNSLAAGLPRAPAPRARVRRATPRSGHRMDAA